MKFIVTADDFGLSKSTNLAIIDGIEKGVITSTNVMVGLDYADDIVEVKAKNPQLSIGLHWNLTTGKPISPLDEISSLVDENGEFYSISEFRERISNGSIKHKEIIKELNAQMDMYITKYGRPDYWNTHNHIQMLPRLFKIFVNLASEHKVFCMRNNYKVFCGRKSVLNIIKNIKIHQMYYYAKKKRMIFPDGLVCYEKSEDKIQNKTYLNILTSNNKTVEIMIHIAAKIDSDKFGGLTEQRIKEYEYFVRGNFSNLVERRVLEVGPINSARSSKDESI